MDAGDLGEGIEELSPRAREASLQSLIRLLVRFILVPLGYLAAVIVGSCVIIFGSWGFAQTLMGNNPDTIANSWFGFIIAGPILFVMIFATMWLPGAVGILISEAFAIRSWIFHALNGAISAWVGWQMFSTDGPAAPNDTSFVFGAGLAGGFAYWAVAGWSAGFWRPIFAPLPGGVTMARAPGLKHPLPNPPPQAGEGLERPPL